MKRAQFFFFLRSGEGRRLFSPETHTQIWKKGRGGEEKVPWVKDTQLQKEEEEGRGLKKRKGENEHLTSIWKVGQDNHWFGGKSIGGNLFHDMFLNGKPQFIPSDPFSKSFKEKRYVPDICTKRGTKNDEKKEIIFSDFSGIKVLLRCPQFQFWPPHFDSCCLKEY